MTILGGWFKVSRKALDEIIHEPPLASLFLYLLSRASLKKIKTDLGVEIKEHQLIVSLNQLSKDLIQDKRWVKIRLKALEPYGFKTENTPNGMVIDISGYVAMFLNTEAEDRCASTPPSEAVDDTRCAGTPPPVSQHTTPGVGAHHPRCASTPPKAGNPLSNKAPVPLKKVLEEGNNKREEGSARAPTHTHKEGNQDPLDSLDSNHEDQEEGPSKTNVNTVLDDDLDKVDQWCGLIQKFNSKAIYDVNKLTKVARMARPLLEKHRLHAGDLDMILLYINQYGSDWLKDRFFNHATTVLLTGDNGESPFEEGCRKFIVHVKTEDKRRKVL